MANYRGIYINLDRSASRRAAMEAQFATLGVASIYSRFQAIDGNALSRRIASRIGPGEEGAFHSHTGALREAAAWKMPVHILEDDALLSSVAPAVIEQAIAAGLLDRFDILFTDTFVAPDLGMLKLLTHASEQKDRVAPGKITLSDLQLIDVSKQNFACLTSYVVAPKAISRLVSLLDAQLDSGPVLPIDLFLRQCAHAGRLTAGLLAPFVTSFNLDEVRQSTIAAGTAAAKPSVMVMAVLRHLFFVERDLSFARSCLEAVTGTEKPVTEQSKLMMQALQFVLSEEFRQF
jgi:GR25 family glycosyltransferase involved in LPS biosynthesis